MAHPIYLSIRSSDYHLFMHTSNSPSAFLFHPHIPPYSPIFPFIRLLFIDLTVISSRHADIEAIVFLYLLI